MRLAGGPGAHELCDVKTRRLGGYSCRSDVVAACLVAFAVALPFAASAAQAADVTLSDLQAAARSLGFLDSLTRDGTIVVGFVYPASSDAGKAQAASLADRLRSIPGPNSAMFRTEIIASSDLNSFAGRLDAVFLAPGTNPEAKAIADAILQKHLVSISSDPACLAAKTCVLMIRTDRGVEINLDTALAGAVGARFSPVFSMMVKRR